MEEGMTGYRDSYRGLYRERLPGTWNSSCIIIMFSSLTIPANVSPFFRSVVSMREIICSLKLRG